MQEASGRSEKALPSCWGGRISGCSSKNFTRIRPRSFLGLHRFRPAKLRLVSSRTKGRKRLLELLQDAKVPLSALKLSREGCLTEMATRTFLQRLVEVGIVTASGDDPILYSWTDKGLVNPKKAVIAKRRETVTFRWEDHENPSNIIRITISGLPPGKIARDDDSEQK
jgi:hypothetical protein